MRFAASPLLVAVALGLLGPAALEEEDDLEELTFDAAPLASGDAPSDPEASGQAT